MYLLLLVNGCQSLYHTTSGLGMPAARTSSMPLWPFVTCISYRRRRKLGYSTTSRQYVTIGTTWCTTSGVTMWTLLLVVGSSVRVTSTSSVVCRIDSDSRQLVFIEFLSLIASQLVNNQIIQLIPFTPHYVPLDAGAPARNARCVQFDQHIVLGGIHKPCWTAQHFDGD